MLNTKDRKNNCDIHMKVKFQLMKATDHAEETALCMYYLQEKYHENHFYFSWFSS